MPFRRHLTLLTRRRARNRATGARRTGFTLLELALSLTLLGSVLLALNRFALGSLSASATNIEMADVRRQVAYTQQLLRADLAQARACDVSGYGSPLLRLDGVSGVRRVAVYTTATADSSPQLVEWRFYPDGQVYRLSTVGEWGNLCDARISLSVAALDTNAEAPAEGESGPLTGSEQLEILATARNVYNVTLTGIFTYLGPDGSPQTIQSGGYDGLCVGRQQATCYAQQLQLTFSTVTSGSEPIVTPFIWDLPVELSNARM
jgi:prepilin-type N-terminal cleavage/methylation domain-containing protein